MRAEMKPTFIVVLFTLLRPEVDAILLKRQIGDASPECIQTVLHLSRKEQQCFYDNGDYAYDSLDGRRDAEDGSATDIFPSDTAGDDHYDYEGNDYEGSGFSANDFDFAKSCSSKICWNAMNKILSKCKVSSCIIDHM